MVYDIFHTLSNTLGFRCTRLWFFLYHFSLRRDRSVTFEIFFPLVEVVHIHSGRSMFRAVLALLLWVWVLLSSVLDNLSYHRVFSFSDAPHVHLLCVGEN